MNVLILQWCAWVCICVNFCLNTLFEVVKMHLFWWTIEFNWYFKGEKFSVLFFNNLKKNQKIVHAWCNFQNSSNIFKLLACTDILQFFFSFFYLNQLLANCKLSFFVNHLKKGSIVLKINVYKLKLNSQIFFRDLLSNFNQIWFVTQLSKLKV